VVHPTIVPEAWFEPEKYRETTATLFRFSPLSPHGQSGKNHSDFPETDTAVSDIVG
jgi:hypothetical protein